MSKVYKKGLDERQVQKRDSIGNQTFILLLYLLLLDAGLYGFGLRWLSYPANIIVILTVCSGIYVIRMIASGAFVGPAVKNQKPLLKIVSIVFLAVMLAAAVIAVLINTGFSSSVQTSDISAPLMFISAGVAILIAVITFLVRKIQERKEE